MLAHEIADLLAEARRQAARSVNAILTATYYEIGRRIVVFEQDGKARADYGKGILNQLSAKLTSLCNRGFGVDNLERMRSFYLTHPTPISATLSRKSVEDKNAQTVSAQFDLAGLAESFPLSWSHYVRFLTVNSEAARQFYGGNRCAVVGRSGSWIGRSRRRHTSGRRFPRTKPPSSAPEAKRRMRSPTRAAVKDPYVLEFLGLKDEYSEGELEEGLIRHLESFLLELGADFTFVARQKRINIGTE